MGTAAETAGLSYMWLITLVTSQNRGKVCVNTLSSLGTAETAGLRYMWLIALVTSQGRSSAITGGWRRPTCSIVAARRLATQRNALIVRKQIADQLDSFPFVQTELK
jgi:hypothetical protein